MNHDQREKYVAKTFYGLEDLLAGELEAIGITKFRKANRAIQFHATKEQIYKLNYTSRIAFRILKPLISFTATNEQTLYLQAKQYDWTSLFDVSKTFAVSAKVNSNYFNHSGFLALKVKDAIVDRFREDTERRPNVNPKSPSVQIEVSVKDNKCTIFLDTSGDPLFKRGYRQDTGKAPLNEILAAALIDFSEWEPSMRLVDLMCGSGTIPIEAALKGLSIPAGFNRQSFGFMGTNDFDRDLWNAVSTEENEKISEDNVSVFGSDKIFSVIAKAKRNASSFSKVARSIRFTSCDFLQSENSESRGTLVLNPPYGERIYKGEISDLYKEFAEHVSDEFAGWKLGVLSSDFEAMESMGLPLLKGYDLMNGPIKCGFNLYQL